MTEQDLDIAKIKETLVEIGKRCGFKATDNLDKIANAKYRFFGADEFRRCACFAQDETMYCCSDKCKKEIAENKICDCRLFEIDN